MKALARWLETMALFALVGLCVGVMLGVAWLAAMLIVGLAS
jgi:hypothetical protein